MFRLHARRDARRRLLRKRQQGEDGKERLLETHEQDENVVLEFRPSNGQLMLVACLWSHWSAPGEPDLLSFAAITDEPPPEVAAAGHDRCIVPIKPENIDAWLNPHASNLKRCMRFSTTGTGRTTSIGLPRSGALPKRHNRPKGSLE